MECGGYVAWSGLRHFALDISGFLLLLPQLGLDRQIGIRLSVKISAYAGIRTGRHSFLALIVGDTLQACLNLLPEVVLHLLKVADKDYKHRSRCAVAFMTSGHENGDLIVCVGHVHYSRENVSWNQTAFMAASRRFV
jgi:hypothetical protein